MALELDGEDIGIQEKIETILKMNIEFGARSTQGGERALYSPLLQGDKPRQRALRNKLKE